MIYKKALLLLGILFLPLLIQQISPLKAGAVDVISGACNNANNPTGEQPTVCKDNQSSGSNGNLILGKDGVVTKGLEIFLVIVGVVSVFVILINATRLITGGSEPASVNSAKNGIIYAVIGLVIAASAQAIISFVINKL